MTGIERRADKTRRFQIGLVAAATSLAMLLSVMDTAQARRRNCSNENIGCLNKCNGMPDDKGPEGPKLVCLRECGLNYDECVRAGGKPTSRGPIGNPPPKRVYPSPPPQSGGTKQPPPTGGRSGTPGGLSPPTPAGNQQPSGGGTTTIERSGGRH